MGSSRFLPLVIAGIVGLFVGWLFGPDVGDVEEAVIERVDQLDARIAEIQAPLGAVQSAVSSVDERTTAIATQVQSMGNPAEALAAITGKIDTVAAEGKTATDALAEKLAALEVKLDAMAAAPAAPAPASGGGEADALASQIGNTGAVLLAGQTAIFGEKRLTVASVGNGTASIGAEGAVPGDVATGASVDLGDGCSVALAGVSGTAAYLAPTGCSTGGTAATAPAPAAPDPAETPAPAVAEAAAPAPAEAAPAADAAATSPASESWDGKPISIGQSGLFGEKRVFLSRVSTADNTAFVFVPGGSRMEVKTDAAADLGDGCMLTLSAIEGTTAAFTSSGCGGESAAAPAAAAEPSAAEPAATAATADAAPAPAGGSNASVGVGQTATFGEKRLFVSRVTPEKVFVVVVGTGPVEVATGASADLGGGCTATLDKIEGNLASFTPSGC